MFLRAISRDKSGEHQKAVFYKGVSGRVQFAAYNHHIQKKRIKK
jgi:hypothetical protein